MVVDDAGPAVFAVFVGDRVQLFDDHGADLALALQEVFQFGDLFFQIVDLLCALENIFFIDIAQLDFRDELRLHLVDAEADHQIWNDFRVGLRLADDADGLVDVEQDALEALEQVQLFGFFLLLVIDAAADAFGAPSRPLLDDLPHAEHLRHTGDQDVEVAAEGVAPGGRAEEPLHELFGIDAALEVDRQLQAGEVGLVADVGDFAELARLVQLRDLVDDRLDRRRVGDLINFDEILFLDVAPAGADLHAASAGAVDLRHFLRIVEDLAAGGEVRRGHVLQQVAVRIFDPSGGRLADLAEIEAADVARHADGDAHVRGHQYVREGGGQQHRLLHGVVVVVDEIHGLAVDVAEDLLADAVQLRLRITRGGVGGVAGVDLAEVALRVHEGDEQGLVAAGKTHHRLVDRGVAVRVEAHGLADDVRGLGARAAQQAHFIHGIQQLAVRGLEAVDLGDRARYDDAHGVGHVVDGQRIGDRLFQHLSAQTLHAGGVRRRLLCRFFLLSCHENTVLCQERSARSIYWLPFSAI